MTAAEAKAPPADIEAEACVLGSMMLDAMCIDKVMQIVQAGDFYRPVCHDLHGPCRDARGRCAD